VSSFRKILVGIDLSSADHLDSAALGAANATAVQHALWVARASGAQLTFFAALNETGQGWHWFTPRHREQAVQAVHAAAQRVLGDLVRRGQEQGVRSDFVLAPGKAWLEIIRQVLRGGHDLVLVADHAPGTLRRSLLRSTARKLVRQCPCPVWVTRPTGIARPHNVLVASDLSPVAEEALRVGLRLGRLAQAQQYLLHVVEYPLDRLWSTGVPEDWTTAYHQNVRHAVEQELRAQLDRTGCRKGECTVHTQVADGDGLPDDAILAFIQNHAVDLLVLGTVGRGGLSGLLLGNTAERLLAEVPCAILAVKPADFHSPVRLD
jgi:universal stress protein E